MKAPKPSFSRAASARPKSSTGWRCLRQRLLGHGCGSSSWTRPNAPGATHCRKAGRPTAPRCPPCAKAASEPPAPSAPSESAWSENPRLQLAPFRADVETHHGCGPSTTQTPWPSRHTPSRSVGCNAGSEPVRVPDRAA